MMDGLWGMESAKYNISKNKQGQRDKSRSGALTLSSFHTRVLGLSAHRLANFKKSGRQQNPFVSS